MIRLCPAVPFHRCGAAAGTHGQPARWLSGPWAGRAGLARRLCSGRSLLHSHRARRWSWRFRLSSPSSSATSSPQCSSSSGVAALALRLPGGCRSVISQGIVAIEVRSVALAWRLPGEPRFPVRFRPLPLRSSASMTARASGGRPAGQPLPPGPDRRASSSWRSSGSVRAPPMRCVARRRADDVAGLVFALTPYRRRACSAGVYLFEPAVGCGLGAEALPPLRAPVRGVHHRCVASSPTVPFLGTLFLLGLLRERGEGLRLAEQHCRVGRRRSRRYVAAGLASTTVPAVTIRYLLTGVCPFSSAARTSSATACPIIRAFTATYFFPTGSALEHQYDKDRAAPLHHHVRLFQEQVFNLCTVFRKDFFASLRTTLANWSDFPASSAPPWGRLHLRVHPTGWTPSPLDRGVKGSPQVQRADY